MNHYRKSNGQKISKEEIDRLVRIAKKQVIDAQFEKYGYNFCEDCGQNASTFLDCSHDVSVDDCQKNGMAEKAYDVNNITIRCRRCHQKYDKNGINI